MFHNFPDQILTYLNDTLLYFPAHKLTSSLQVDNPFHFSLLDSWRGISQSYHRHYQCKQWCQAKDLCDHSMFSACMGYFNAVSMPHWKQSSRRQIISPNCLVSNSYLKHLTLQWRGVIGHKLKSVPFIKDLVFILFEKKAIRLAAFGVGNAQKLLSYKVMWF